VCSAGRGSGRRLDWPLVRCSIWGSLCGRRRRMIGARSVVEFGQLAGNESPSKPCISYLRYTHCVCSLRKECPSRASFCFSDAEGLLHSTTTATDPPQPHTTTSCLPRAQNTGKPPPRRAALAQPRLPTLLGTGSKPLLRVGPGTTGYYYYAARDAFPYPAK
jgi:hypothetical protein